MCPQHEPVPPDWPKLLLNLVARMVCLRVALSMEFWLRRGCAVLRLHQTPAATA